MPIKYKLESNITQLKKLSPELEVEPHTLTAVQQMMKQLKGCAEFGPLKLCYDVDLPDVKVTISVLGITIGTIDLNPTQPCQTVKINLFVASGKLELCVKDTCLKLSGEVCVAGQCANFDDITVFCWG